MMKSGRGSKGKLMEIEVKIDLSSIQCPRLIAICNYLFPLAYTIPPLTRLKPCSLNTLTTTYALFFPPLPSLLSHLTLAGLNG